MPEAVTPAKASTRTRSRLDIGEDNFTTGQIARFCRVAPRTVSKWIDSGKLKGYRVPGATDRRVTRASLEAFFAENGMPPLPPREGEGLILLVGFRPADAERVHKGLTGVRGVIAARSAFEAGLLAARNNVSTVVVDGEGVGRIEAVSVAAGVRSHLGESVRLVFVGPHDSPAAAGFDAAVAAGLVVEWAVSR